MTGIIWQKPLVLRAAVFSFLAFAFLLMGGGFDTRAQAITEGFDTVTSNDPMPLPGWVAINNSKDPGGSLWFQGNPTVFASHAGAPNAYIGANFQATLGDSTISAWLLTPQRSLSNGDVIQFYTRTVTGSIYPDRLQVRLSTSGASTDVGAGPTGVGDFSTLLLDINPTYQVGGYPENWTVQTLTLSGLPSGASGRIAFRYFVENGGPDGVNSNYIGVDTFTFTPGSTTAPAAHQESDYDGDGRTDYSVFRNTGGGPNGQATWYNRRSSDGVMYAVPWGLASDFGAPDDYDGDNKTDVAVWRAGPPGEAAYYILYTATSTMSAYQFGQTGDNPDVHRDYDGDGHADPAVFRAGASAGQQSFWFYRGSLNNPNGDITYVPWGQNGDFPVPGDYDGNGRADFVVQRNNGDGSARFFMLFSDGKMNSVVFGQPTDFVVPGDYDGDGTTDIATARPAGGQWNWFVLPSSTGTINPYPYAIFGNSGTDFLCQGDYDGDGRTDPAVFRSNPDPSMNYFYHQGSTSGFGAFEWGAEGDYPAANWNTH